MKKLFSLAALLMVCGAASAQTEKTQSTSGTQDTVNVTKMDKVSQRNPVGNSNQPQDKAYLKNEDKSSKKAKSKPMAKDKPMENKNNPDPIVPAK